MDERDPSIVTETIRLHRLVRAVVAGRLQGEATQAARRALIEAMAAVYPSTVFNDPSAWPRARRFDALALDLVGGAELPKGAETSAGFLLDRLGAYRQSALASYAQARPLFERALAMHEKAFGPEHPSTATSLNNLAFLLKAQGDLAAAQPLCERALAIEEKLLGPEHPDTAPTLNNLALILQDQGDLAGARPLFERALAIDEKALGPEHPHTNVARNNLARLRLAQHAPSEALALSEAALAAHDMVLGTHHRWTINSARVTADALAALGRANEAAALRARYGMGGGAG